jgi:hypothetical protein
MLSTIPFPTLFHHTVAVMHDDLIQIKLAETMLCRCAFTTPCRMTMQHPQPLHQRQRWRTRRTQRKPRRP